MSCPYTQKKTDDSTSSNSQNAPTTSTSTASTTTEPSSSSQTNSTTSSASGKLGVAPQGTTCPSDAPIKGVTSKKQGKLYHTTKYPDYSKVKPEKCFADVATAEKAGYKAPQ